MEVPVKGLLPQYMTEGAAGADLASSWGHDIYPDQKVKIDTGTALKLPEGHVGFLVPRSSLCNKHGLVLCNSVGVLDEDYTGTVKFVYKNTGNEVIHIARGERIGQVVVVPYVKAEFVEVDELESTERGSGGYGSTGK